MDILDQINDFAVSMHKSLKSVTISSDPSLYARKVEARDAFITARRKQRRHVASNKRAFLNSHAY